MTDLTFSRTQFTKDEKTFLINLPGKKFYKEDIYVKTLTFGDISQLTTILSQEDEKRMFELLQEKLSIDILELTLFDFYYILYWHRYNSYNESEFPLSISFVCNDVDCLEKNNKQIKLSDIKIKNPDEKMKKSYLNVKFSDEKIAKYKIPTIKDYLLSLDLIKELRIKEQKELILTTLCLDFFEDEELNQSIKKKLSYLKKLSPIDFLMLKEAEKKFSYGIEDYIDLNCSHCEKSNKIALKTSMFNLFPSLPSNGSMESRIFFDYQSDEDGSTGDNEDGTSEGNVL